MKILMAHNYYKIPGGEDESFRLEFEMLASNGHEVTQYIRRNTSDLNPSPLINAANTIWNPSVYRDIFNIVKNNRIEIAHFQNTFPIISPSAYYAANKAGARVIQSLRNYRLLCVNGLQYRNNRICTICESMPIPLYGVKHRCYQDSALASSAVNAMIGIHKMIGTYDKYVDAYIAISHHVKEKYVRMGIARNKIYVKPNIVDDYNIIGAKERSDFVFVGRLSPEKGICELIDAWKNIDIFQRLIIVGDGPLRDSLAVKSEGRPNILFVGKKDINEVHEILSSAKAIIIPSKWEEPFGRVAVEALSHGTPIIAARRGGLKEIVKEGVNGFLFDPEDVEDITNSIKDFLANNENWLQISHNARESYNRLYNTNENYRMLMNAYRGGIIDDN